MPVAPAFSYVFAFRFLLREIELAALALGALVFGFWDGGGLETIAVGLLVSKTDAGGCGARRILACTCGLGQLDAATSPVHQLKKHLVLLQDRFG